MTGVQTCALPISVDRKAVRAEMVYPYSFYSVHCQRRAEGPVGYDVAVLHIAVTATVATNATAPEFVSPDGGGEQQAQRHTGMWHLLAVRAP